MWTFFSIDIILPLIKIRLRELDFSKDRRDRGEDGKGESTIIFYHHNYNSKCPFHHHHHFHHYHFHHHQCNYDPGQGWGRPKDWDLLGGFSRYYKCQTCSWILMLIMTLTNIMLIVDCWKWLSWTSPWWLTSGITLYFMESREGGERRRNQVWK